MFGSTPFIFKRPTTTERRLNEGALSASGDRVRSLPSGAAVASICIYIARINSVRFRLTKEAGCGLRAARGEYERTTTHCADRGRRAGRPRRFA